ncbi:CARDB domain-containing protein [Nonomuraea sp. NPDC046570]|uniref:CARDB domain-containing protein n=1 Tax=Nonomuraea sp. NPDC046570 TaxID=3155255 RepID=UPI0033EBB826
MLASEATPVHALAALPDLVVTSVATEPAAPYTGDATRFTAVVKNQGDAATSDGTVIGGVFRVNGSTVVYTDNHSASLGPGESVRLTSNGGGTTGNGTWSAQTGSHTLGFLVDDVKRIQEGDETNNDYTSPDKLSVAEKQGPDLVIDQVTFSPTNLRPGSKLTLHARVSNVGNQSTGTKIAVAFAHGSVQLGTVRGSTLAAGTSATVDLKTNITIRPGQISLKATADPAKKITETREDNNDRALDLRIGQNVSEAANASDSFVESIGVNTHLSYYDTPYGNYDGLVKPLLKQAGIRYQRTGASLQDTKVPKELKDLAANGIHTNWIADPSDTPAEIVQYVKSAAPAIVSVEGPNEPDVFTPSQFPDGTRAFQNDLYKQVKADPDTKHLPVLAPTPVRNGSAAKLGQVSCDIGNAHPYPGGNIPTISLDANLANASVVCPDRPVQITETGYHNALQAISGQPGISEKAGAKYIPRTYLESFRRGLPRTYVYEFIDEFEDPNHQDPEARFGMVRHDGTPKPAFTALKNTISLLADPGADFKPGTLDYQLSGDLTNVHRVLLQRRDGSFQLVLWLNTPSFDLSSKTDTTAPPQTVKVDLPSTFAKAQTFLPVTSTSSTATYNNPTSLTLSVPDQPLVVTLTPR